MPPFPWHFGGQHSHNLFVEPSFIEQFCRLEGYRVRLDVSHSRLVYNHIRQSFSKFLKFVLPYTAHLHLADARGADGKGIQIGKGELDWN